MGRADLSGRRLAIIVSTAPERGDFDRVERLARAARARQLEVGIFLMDAAVVWGAHERASALVNEHACDVILCGTNASKQGVAIAAGVVDGVLEGSQDDHAALVHRADRVVAFT
jgi:sulfur relay (sulfurtransferase) complex TusBCD TusD component (DsrE family)